MKTVIKLFIKSILICFRKKDRLEIRVKNSIFVYCVGFQWGFGLLQRNKFIELPKFCHISYVLAIVGIRNNN